MPRGGARPNSGGKRPGAGRKPGPVTVKTRAVADADAMRCEVSGDIEPLDVVLTRMRVEYAAGNFDTATNLAVYALPYRHPRLSAVMVGNADGSARLRLVEEIVDVIDHRPGGETPPPAA